MPEGDFSPVDAHGRKYLTSGERSRFLAAARPAVRTFTTIADCGELYRALWIQGTGIVTILTALRFIPT